MAIVGTPRSGNTWLRGLLANVLELEERAVHNPDSVGWDGLPPRCVLQIHWYPTADFLETLDRHGFRTISPARHPLDVLLSTLNYAYYTHDSASCGQEACATCSILGVAPRSPQFLEYARGEFARNVQGISLAWWTGTAAIRVRYEDLCADTPGTIRGIVAQLGLSPRVDPVELAARYAIEPLQRQQDVMHYHYWQGRPGHWRCFLTADEAYAMAAAHQASFDVHGYTCDPDPALDPVRADLNWYRLQLGSTRGHLRLERQKHRATREALEAVQAQLDTVHGILWTERQQHAWAIGELERTLAALRGQAAPGGTAAPAGPGTGTMTAAG